MDGSDIFATGLIAGSGRCSATVSCLVLGVSVLDRSLDGMVVNPGFDQGCESVTRGGRILSRLQNGRTQHYLRVVGIAFVALVLFLIWGKRG